MKSILFNIDEVKAILDGRKTQTRRPIKPKYKDDEYGFNVITNPSTGERWVEKHDDNEASFCPTRYVNPKYEIGDIPYAKETFAKHYCGDFDIDGLACNVCDRNFFDDGGIMGIGCYIYKSEFPLIKVKWKSPATMPKEAARIFLRVTAIRVERVEDWVWVYEFERCEKPEVAE